MFERAEVAYRIFVVDSCGTAKRTLGIRVIEDINASSDEMCIIYNDKIAGKVINFASEKEANQRAAA